MSLKRKVVLITGGASGIGRAAAVCCAQAGARVAVADCDRDGVAATIREIEGSGGEARGFEVDVRAEGEVRTMVDSAARAFGRIDGLIHSAGILEGALVPVDLFEADTWDRVLDVNLKGSFLLCKHVTPVLERSDRGVIVLVSSGAGVRGGSSSAAYGSSKGGVHGLSLVLAPQLASRGIRVNALCPGSLDTPLKMEVLRKQADREGRCLETMRAGLGKPEGVGRVLAFLVSDDADYVRGTVFTR
ncbi:MAG: SDR family NAD(P)-dependent oxidoreductase [Gemmatimonadota bacterium]|nr:SDR family NAD(P)-dependent oxidoreductase [Gemmatimonadota bacterium]